MKSVSTVVDSFLKKVEEDDDFFEYYDAEDYWYDHYDD